MATYLSPRDIEVVVLCGGRGLRLMPITDEIPKPLVYLREQPMIMHILQIFWKWGFRRFHLCIGYKGHMIRDYFAGKQLPYQIDFDDAGEEAGMLQRVLSVKDRVRGDRFVLAFGDALADVDLSSLLKSHRENDSLLTTTVMRLHSPFGILGLRDDGKVLEFKEKPLLDNWVNIGFMVVEKKAFREVPASSTIVDMYQALVARGRFFAFRHEGSHLTVNTTSERAETESQLDAFYTFLNNALGARNGG